MHHFSTVALLARTGKELSKLEGPAWDHLLVCEKANDQEFSLLLAGAKLNKMPGTNVLCRWAWSWQPGGRRCSRKEVLQEGYAGGRRCRRKEVLQEGSALGRRCCRKDRLWKAYLRMQKQWGRKYFHFLPLTYNLPEDRWENRG